MSEKQIKTVEIPEGIELTIERGIVKIKGPKGEIEKELSYPGVFVTKKDKLVEIKSDRKIKKKKAVVGTYEAHIKNMIKGVTEGYTAELKAVFAHFPITIKQEDDVIEVHNFLGEKVPRKGKVKGNVEIKIQKDRVTITGIDKEAVGQTAANIELSTKVRNRDTRIFQDGVYIIKKP
jgi:large subunit ribosomal protein L6